MLNTLCLGDNSLPPLIFLHGLLGSSEDFLPIMHELKDSFHCIGIDLPGHGLSPALTPISFQTTLNAIMSALVDHGTQKPSIVGYSLGGRLAMLLDLHYPSFFKTLCILSAHPGLSKKDLPAYRLQEKRWITLIKQDIHQFLTLWYQQPLFATLTLSHIVEKRSHINGKEIALLMKALSLTKQPPLWDHLMITQTPLLALHGTLDAKYRALYTSLPRHITHEAIPDASHAIHIENPSLCAQKIKKFITINYP